MHLSDLLDRYDIFLWMCAQASLCAGTIQVVRGVLTVRIPLNQDYREAHT